MLNLRSVSNSFHLSAAALASHSVSQNFSFTIVVNVSLNGCLTGLCIRTGVSWFPIAVVELVLVAIADSVGTSSSVLNRLLVDI